MHTSNRHPNLVSLFFVYRFSLSINSSSTYSWNYYQSSTIDVMHASVVACWIFTVRNSSCGKLMFSQVCVKNSVHAGGASLWAWGVYTSGHTPRTDTHPTPPPRWPLQRTVRILLECIIKFKLMSNVTLLASVFIILIFFTQVPVSFTNTNNAYLNVQFCISGRQIVFSYCTHIISQGVEWKIAAIILNWCTRRIQNINLGCARFTKFCANSCAPWIDFLLAFQWKRRHLLETKHPKFTESITPQCKYQRFGNFQWLRYYKWYTSFYRSTFNKRPTKMHEHEFFLYTSRLHILHVTYFHDVSCAFYNHRLEENLFCTNHKSTDNYPCGAQYAHLIRF